MGMLKAEGRLAALEGDPNHEAVERLRVALVQSAMRANGETLNV